MNTTRVVTEKANTLNSAALVALGSALTLVGSSNCFFQYKFSVDFRCDKCLLRWLPVLRYPCGYLYSPYKYYCRLGFCTTPTNHQVDGKKHILLELISFQWASGCAAVISFVLCCALFFWTVYLINSEDKFLERIGARDNRIVTSTRIAMYTLELFIIPVHGEIIFTNGRAIFRYSNPYSSLCSLSSFNREE